MAALTARDADQVLCFVADAELTPREREAS